MYANERVYTSCYVRDEDDYLRNHCSTAPGISNFPILQHNYTIYSIEGDNIAI